MKKISSSVVLVGASGLIGNHILTILLQDPDFDRVTILVRRATHLVHPKLVEKIVDFSNEHDLKNALIDCTHVFCAVGTTQKKVKGNQQLYRNIDFDIPVNIATLASSVGCIQFLLVSAVGANSSSKNFYTRLKGEVEDAVSQINIPDIVFFQPSILLGNRKEFRFGELIGQKLAIAFRWLIPTKYKPIPAEKVAQSMVNRSKFFLPGVHRWHYLEMVKE